MNFTDIFIKRPVLAVSISLLITLLGLQAFSKLAVRQYPDMTNTVITVTTSYYGANSDLIQGFITQPLQQAIAQADNIDYITSTSQMGTSTITVNMKLNTDPNGALADVLSRVNSVRSQLPSEAQDPSLTLSTGSSTSVLYLSFYSDTLSAPQITDYLNRVISPQLFTVNGISKVNLYGGSNFALRIWLNPAKMALYGLTASDVLAVLQANNYQASAGQVIGYYNLFNTDAQTQVTDTEGLEELIVSTSKGTVVKIKDLAIVTMETSHDSYRALANGSQAVLIGIDATPTANPLDIAKDVNKLLPAFEKNLPPSIKMQPIYDSTVAIDESINEVIHTIVEAAIIVLIVITLFMGSFRAVIIPIITIPLSMIGVLMLMDVCGFSINLLTLLAMVLAIGLVVDDAIVVVENVDRHIKEGATPFVASIRATREIAVPVISMTITLCAVYSPIALMGGITGSLFKEFALTLAGAVLISGIIALTLSPMMCSKMLKQETKESFFAKLVNTVLNKVTDLYTKALTEILGYRRIIIFSSAIIFCSLPFLFKYTASELAPYEDNGAYMIMSKGTNTANLDLLQDGLSKINKTVLEDPAINATIGFAGMPASNQALSIAVLKDYSEREDISTVMSRITSKISSNPNLTAQSVMPAALPGASSGYPIQLVIMTPNSFAQLSEVTTDIVAKLQKSGLFAFIDPDLSFDSATVEITVNRQKAGAYGITMKDIGSTLSTMVADGYINRVAIDGRAYEVIPQVIRAERLTPESLNSYYVRAQDGTMIPLGSIIEVTTKSSPRVLSQMSQQNAVTISMVLLPSVSMGQAISFFEEEIIPNLPAGYTHDYKGESRQFVTEGSSLVTTFGLAIVIIFLVLACQFESWKDPCVILIAVPLAMSGALLMLALGLATMNIYTQVGLITLVGLIAKHGILMCEVSKEQQLLHGADRIEAIKVAASIRLRPILMTTAAMVAGLLPLLIASGAGAQSRFAIGLVIVAGLSIGTIFTLFVLPVIYSIVGQKHKPLPDTDHI